MRRSAAEAADDAGDVGFQLVMPLWVLENHRARALHPARVVQARLRRVLLAGMRERVPDTVEQDEHHADLVPVGRGEELLDPVEEALRIFLPRQVVQKDPDAGEAQALGPAELAVDRGQVERVGLPHLELVDRRARREVAADEPGMFTSPCLGPRDRPGAWLGGGAATRVGVKTRVSTKASAAVIRPRIGRLMGRSIVSDTKDENRLADRDERSLRGFRSKNQPDAPWPPGAGFHLTRAQQRAYPGSRGTSEYRSSGQIR